MFFTCTKHLLAENGLLASEIDINLFAAGFMKTEKHRSTVPGWSNKFLFWHLEVCLRLMDFQPSGIFAHKNVSFVGTMFFFR